MRLALPILIAATLISACTEPKSTNALRANQIQAQKAKNLPPTNFKSALAEVKARENRFPDYPKPNTTYLSFSKLHGFQVNYLAPNGRAWLWYPGNSRIVPEEYRRDTVSGVKAICWRHPPDSFNPVTRTRGGPFRCTSLDLAQRTMVASIAGDPYSLSSGNVPYVLNQCAAPAEFRFDRDRFSC